MSLCDRCKNKCKFMLKNKTLDTCGLFEKRTNFDRITASPEALAEWLNEHSDYCREIQNWQCDKCPYGDKDCPIENTWLDWLNEECKDE